MNDNGSHLEDPKKREFPTLDHVAKRNDIIRKAAELFDRRGYHETSMGALAKAIGIAKPSLYHYFSGKTEILFGVHQEFITLLITSLEHRLQRDLAPSEQLRAVIQDIFGVLSTHRGHVRVFFENHRQLPDELKQVVRQQRQYYSHLVESIIRQGIEEGEFEDVDPRRTALALFGMCNWGYQWYRREGTLSSVKIADEFHSLIMHGLSAN